MNPCCENLYREAIKEMEIRDKEITNLKIEQHFNLKLINELKAENDIFKNYTIVGYKIGIEELESQNKRLDMAKSLYEGRCKKLEMEKHKLIAALLIYAECENDGSGDMYYNYDIARTTLTEIGHESFEGL